jgi:hypothetical protein
MNQKPKPKFPSGEQADLTSLLVPAWIPANDQVKLLAYQAFAHYQPGISYCRGRR